MRAHPSPAAAFVALLLAAIVVASCSSTSTSEGPWVRTRSDAISLKSAKFWCTKTIRERFHKSHPSTTGRTKKRVLDEDCMATRGWQRKKSG